MKVLLPIFLFAALGATSGAHAQQLTVSNYTPAPAVTNVTTFRCGKAADAASGEVRIEHTFDGSRRANSIASVVFDKSAVSKNLLAKMNSRVGSKTILGVSAECIGRSVRLAVTLWGSGASQPSAMDSFLIMKSDAGSIEIR
ncbi:MULTISPECIES: hypothetical protein [unclassified Lysobacter]|uniref:hypothetical protein n=1 Tax=unclassified Lysobacter TaxID=2635362 RepID=UPI001BE6A4B4|nr:MULTISPECIES: hypothetical protein [unclassified Lysobacter]MBT2748323.1 hypothetical protein [Lysobacter sp. ISL-42]MBT2749910.1 hypothetical protein [Lysobacter sp. ISL-50]MBT2781238.1 hypothetical protein [Lysobacter sp. ISL-52]